MLDKPIRDRAAERREATRREILDAAWTLAQEKGLAEFTLRDVAERVGMRAPSLYTHFASKGAIYDAMFGQAWADYEQVALAELADLPPAPRSAVRRMGRVFFDFAVASPVRHQLMKTTFTSWPGPDIVRPAIDRATSMELAETEYQRVANAVDALRAEDWTRPTDCTGWDVRQLVAHIVGMAKFTSTPLEMTRQMRAAKVRRQDGQALVDAQTAVQVQEREHLGPEELRVELRDAGPRATKGRRRTPGVIRRLRLPEPQVVNGVPETWSLGYLTDVILTRDPWMHRLDLARATGRAPVLTADHDGVIVADVVREWARRHGQPCRLELTGPAGGHWDFDTGGEEIVMDAADFCRVVSGRPGPDQSRPSGLLATQVPF